jgi:hypothetical protein
LISIANFQWMKGEISSQLEGDSCHDIGYNDREKTEASQSSRHAVQISGYLGGVFGTPVGSIQTVGSVAKFRRQKCGMCMHILRSNERIGNNNTCTTRYGAFV